MTLSIEVIGPDDKTTDLIVAAMAEQGIKATNANRQKETTEAASFAEIHAADDKAIGTDQYAGIAYFWNYDYRHDLRDATPARRREVHAKLMAAGLSLYGFSDEHTAIIRS